MHQIFLVTSVASFSVLTYLIIKKAPELADLEEVPSTRKRPNSLLKVKERIFGISFLKGISWNIILQKTLSKMRVVILKIESKIADQLYFLRKKSERKK